MSPARADAGEAGARVRDAPRARDAQPLQETRHAHDAGPQRRPGRQPAAARLASARLRVRETPPAGERPEDVDEPGNADDVGLEAEREHRDQRRRRARRSSASRPPEQRERPGDEEEAAGEAGVDAELGVGRLAGEDRRRPCAPRSSRRCRGRSPAGGRSTCLDARRAGSASGSRCSRPSSPLTAAAGARPRAPRRPASASSRRGEARRRRDVRVDLDEGEPDDDDRERAERRAASRHARRSDGDDDEPERERDVGASASASRAGPAQRSATVGSQSASRGAQPQPPGGREQERRHEQVGGRERREEGRDEPPVADGRCRCCRRSSRAGSRGPRS